MRSVDKLLKLADRFDRVLRKFADELQTEQKGTNDLFFGGDDNAVKFGKLAGELSLKGESVVGSGPVAKVLADHYNKTKKSAGYSLTVTADPDTKKVSFNVTANPPSLKSSIEKAINETYKKLTGKDMSTATKEIQEKVNKGFGNGTKETHSLNIDE